MGISMKIFPRRSQIGFLPLSFPIVHIWYYRFRRFPLTYLIGFSQRTFTFIFRCERFVAEELYINKTRFNQFYFSSESLLLERNTSFNVKNVLATKRLLRRRKER